MIPSDLIGSRPMDLDTAQRRSEREVEYLARFISVVILAGIGWGAYALWGWL